MEISQRARDDSKRLQDFLSARTDLILRQWRTAARTDPRLSTAMHLSRAQFDDHIPRILEDFSELLVAEDDAEQLSGHTQARKDTEDHGLLRWQQGYELHQLAREWGHLHLVLLDELEAFTHQHPDLSPPVLPRARRLLAALCADGMSRSAERYWRLHQIEASGQVRDLEAALARVTSAERERVASWRGAAHDLRGGFGAVELATVLLEEPGSDGDREESLVLLKQNVAGLRDMLNELLDLARLEAGHELIDIAAFDAAEALHHLCDGLRHRAQAKGLHLHAQGPATLSVTGDRRKVTRVIQNLILNAINYTSVGSVTVTWRDDPQDDRWAVTVADTGPGFTTRSGEHLRHAIADATTTASEVDSDVRKHAPAAAEGGESTRVETPARGGASHGEGIGLSIVKRLCELLDAVVELESQPGQGSTFCIHFPRDYPGRR